MVPSPASQNLPALRGVAGALAEQARTPPAPRRREASGERSAGSPAGPAHSEDGVVVDNQLWTSPATRRWGGYAAPYRRLAPELALAAATVLFPPQTEGAVRSSSPAAAAAPLPPRIDTCRKRKDRGEDKDTEAARTLTARQVQAGPPALATTGSRYRRAEDPQAACGGQPALKQDLDQAPQTGLARPAPPPSTASLDR